MSGTILAKDGGRFYFVFNILGVAAFAAIAIQSKLENKLQLILVASFLLMNNEIKINSSRN